MEIIKCAEGCVFQEDGYCTLEKLSTVNTNKAGCPHYLPKLFDYRNSFSETADTDKLD